MAAPPVNAGAVNATVAWPLAALAAAPMVGAPGTIALMANVCVTRAAALYVTSPAWSAWTVQGPAATRASRPPAEMVQTAGVAEVKATVSPELALAASVGVVPKGWAPGLANVMAWLPFGVTAFDAAEAGPVPALLEARTVHVCAVPLASPVAVSGEA